MKKVSLSILVRNVLSFENTIFLFHFPTSRFPSQITSAWTSFVFVEFFPQIKRICRSLLEGCAKSQYPLPNDPLPSPSGSSFSNNTPEMSTSDSDTSENGGTSLLHQALKRKRTDSETEQLFKRQFFLTTAPPNHYFNTTVTNVTQQSQGQSIYKSTNSVLSTAPKFITTPIQSTTSGLLTQSGTTTRPVFHIIQAPNRNLKLSTLRNSHVELCQLLQPNKSPRVTSTVTLSSLSATTASSAANDLFGSSTSTVTSAMKE